MRKYREIQVVVEATKWFKDGDHPKVQPRDSTDEDGSGILEEGWLVWPGDWVVTEVDGESHTFKPHIFEMLYEVFDD